MLIAWSLLACGVGEDAFWNKSAAIDCDRNLECNEDAFYEAYEDVKDCEDELIKFQSRQVETYDELGCEYDRGQAADCLKDKRTVECEDYLRGDVSDCRDVYVCIDE